MVAAGGIESPLFVGVLRQGRVVGIFGIEGSAVPKGRCLSGLSQGIDTVSALHLYGLRDFQLPNN